MCGCGSMLMTIFIVVLSCTTTAFFISTIVLVTQDPNCADVCGTTAATPTPTPSTISADSTTIDAGNTTTVTDATTAGVDTTTTTIQQPPNQQQRLPLRLNYKTKTGKHLPKPAWPEDMQKLYDNFLHLIKILSDAMVKLLIRVCMKKQGL
ncbi:hypothetical protein CHUAL_007019 [Chamberlinius hualienensis]